MTTINERIANEAKGSFGMKDGFAVVDGNEFGKYGYALNAAADTRAKHAIEWRESVIAIAADTEIVAESKVTLRYSFTKKARLSLIRFDLSDGRVILVDARRANGLGVQELASWNELKDTLDLIEA